MIVEDWPCSKASCVVLVKAFHVFWEGEEEGLLIRQGNKSESLSRKGVQWGLQDSDKGQWATIDQCCCIVIERPWYREALIRCWAEWALELALIGHQKADLRAATCASESQSEWYAIMGRGSLTMHVPVLLWCKLCISVHGPEERGWTNTCLASELETLSGQLLNSRRLQNGKPQKCQFVTANAE